ncbi:MAG TPA: NADP-dependent oxidoreductase [Lacipirellulaceae bacterium]|jgi:NADPH:quinone reductase-like Zn-dependent oxidoreductase
MKAIQLHEFGGPENLRLEDARIPEPRVGEVLVRVAAASVNPVDAKLAKNALRGFVTVDLPWIPGADFSGLIVTLGPGIDDFNIGDAVFGSRPTGSQGTSAEFVAVPASTIALKPKLLTHVEAASVPIGALTAWQGLFDHGRLQPGQTVLIHGGSGGVGTFAVQLAHWKGANVIATCSAENLDYVRALGADEVIDYEITRFQTVVKHVDLVFDLVGGETLQNSFGVLAPGGRLVSTVAQPPEAEATKYEVYATQMHMEASGPDLAEIAALFDSGAIRTFVTETYPLERAAEAWHKMAEGHTRGKIVLEVAA